MKPDYRATAKKAWAIPVLFALLNLLPRFEASATPVVHTTDFIADTERSAFNGFEGIPVPVVLTGGVTPFLYAEDGIEVGQIIGTAGTDSIFSAYTDWGAQGQRAWYPNGGDEGYTFIRRQSGADFSSLGLLRGSGGEGKDILLFELYDDGLLVLSGVIPHARTAQYLGFSGGGFDFLRLRDGKSTETTGFLDFSRNHLVIDSIELQDRATPQQVLVDIKPGSFPNSINPKSKGKIPVAILTTDSFDATTVDPTTVLFGATGTEAAPVQSALEDVDGDGNTDMILHFNIQGTGIACGDTSASLTGETFGGQIIKGSDSINTVGCK